MQPTFSEMSVVLTEAPACDKNTTTMRLMRDFLYFVPRAQC